MYNPNKFNYTPLKRETIEGSRKYLTPGGLKLPSVTTILDATQTQEKRQALASWRNRVGHEKAQSITVEAAGRGTRLHKFLENFVKNGSTGEPGSNPYSIQSHKMAESIITHGLSSCDEFWGTEISLYFPKIYAGTTDLVGVHAGSESVMDYKQTNKLKKREWIDDYFIQLLFYGTAHNEIYGTNIRKGVIFMCTADVVYQEFIIEGSEWVKYENQMWERIEKYYQMFV
jgi:genome maintenance exonuclease 1